MFAAGQAVDQAASVRVAPHFISGNGFDPVLVLSNPSASPIAATVTLFSQTGGAVHSSLSTLHPRMSWFRQMALYRWTHEHHGTTLRPSVNGWLRIDSPNVALNGLLILDEGQGITAVPLQTSALDRMIYSQLSLAQPPTSRLVLVNPSDIQAALDVSLVKQDGTTAARTAIAVPARTKLSSLIQDVLPQVAGQDGGYIFIRSSVALYGVEMLGDTGTQFLASVPLARASDGVAANPIVATAAIARVEPGRT